MCMYIYIYICTYICIPSLPSMAQHKSLHKRGAVGRVCTSVVQHQSLHKSGVQKSSRPSKQSKATLTQPIGSHENNISWETQITIIGGHGNNISGRLRPITISRKRLTQQMRLSGSTRRTEQCISARMQTNRSLPTNQQET